MKKLKLNDKFKKEHIVKKNLTTSHVGLRVLSTPSMISLIEKTSNDFIQQYIDVKYTTVGTFVKFSHENPVKINESILIKGKIVNLEKNKIELNITVERKNDGLHISRGTHTRYIINKDDFIKKLKEEN